MTIRIYHSLKRIKLKYQNEDFFSFFKFLILKLIAIFNTCFFCSVVFPISFLLLILYPIIKVRFGPIAAAVFGTYIFDTEYYLRKKTLTKKKYFDFFYFKNKVPINSFLDKLVIRNLKISPFFKYFYYNATILGNINKVYLNSSYKDKRLKTCRDPDDVYFNTKTQLNFYEKEISEGNFFLKKIGVSNDQKYVCLIVRDAAYKKTLSRFFSIDTADRHMHNYRDSKIDDYKSAVKYLLEKGYFVIRMGNVVEKKLEIDDKCFFDYSCSNLKTSFLDIFLVGNSYFNLVSESGLKDVSYVYNVPFCFVNCPFPKITQNWKSKSIFIYKKFKSKSLNRNLTFNEIKFKMDVNNNKINSRISSYYSVFFFS